MPLVLLIVLVMLIMLVMLVMLIMLPLVQPRARNKPSRFKPSQAALDQIKQPSRLGLAWYISPTIRAPPAFLIISISLAPSTASSI